MASIRRRGKAWYYRFIDADGHLVERKGCTDKRATEEMARKAEALAAKVKTGVVNPKELGYRNHDAVPLLDHVAAFEKSLTDKGGTKKHAAASANRVRRVLTLAWAKRISEISLSRTMEALASLREGVSPLGQETINHYIRAVKSFSRWLWKDGRAREHVLAHVATASSEADRRRTRRALLPEEAVWLIQVVESGPDVMEMSGPERAMVYRVALGTGFRASSPA